MDFDFDTDVAEGAATGALRGGVVWRRAGFLPGPASGLVREAAAASADWRRREGYETAPAPVEAARAFAAALARLGLEVRGDPVLVRHAPGAHGAPAIEGVGCLLDLVDDWGSEDGGLVLVLEPEGSVHGWRPEAGALTLYTAARTPLLTMVAPGAAPRYALFAEAEAV